MGWMDVNTGQTGGNAKVMGNAYPVLLMRVKPARCGTHRYYNARLRLCTQGGVGLSFLSALVVTSRSRPPTELCFPLLAPPT